MALTAGDGDHRGRFRASRSPRRSLSAQRIIQRPLLEDELCCILYDVLNGLAYLHKSNILHRDIKPANMLLDQNMRARISDFGISADLKRRVASTNIGTPLFMAPEVLSEERYRRFIVDAFPSLVTNHPINHPAHLLTL